MSKTCSCGKTIEFVTVGSKTVPVDSSAPVYAVKLTADGELEGEHVNKGKAEPNLFVPVYRVGHFSTCPDAGAYSASKSDRLEVLVDILEAVDIVLEKQGAADPREMTKALLLLTMAREQL